VVSGQWSVVSGCGPIICHSEAQRAEESLRRGLVRSQGCGFTLEHHGDSSPGFAGLAMTGWLVCRVGFAFSQ